LGHLNHDRCDKARTLSRALEPVFDPRSARAAALLPALPGFVWTTSPDVLGVSEIERLFASSLQRFSADDLVLEVSWLKSFGKRVRARVNDEASAGSREPDPGIGPRTAAREWWQFVSDPPQANAEWDMVGVRRVTEDADDAERRASSPA